MGKTLLAFFATGLWISLSEFIRNELLFKSYWIDKYASLGMEFPSTPTNNAIWGVWSFVLAGVILYVSKRLRSLETITIIWVMAFVMMWLVVGNMNVLPFGLLPFAIPLSILEVGIGVFLCKKITGTPVK